MNRYKIYYYKNTTENMVLAPIEKLSPIIDNFEYVKTIEGVFHENIFKQMQRIEGQSNEVTNYKNEPIRSMSIGDIIINITEQIGYQVTSIGFKQINPIYWGYNFEEEIDIKEEVIEDISKRICQRIIQYSYNLSKDSDFINSIKNVKEYKIPIILTDHIINYLTGYKYGIIAGIEETLNEHKNKEKEKFTIIKNE